MPRFDWPGRTGPAKTVLHPGGRERVFVLPYDTEDPEDLKLLRKHPLLVETDKPVATFTIKNEAANPTPEDVALYTPIKAPKPSRKEVDE